MKECSFRESPFKMYGVPFFEQTGRLERLPQRVREEVPVLNFLGRRSVGARLCFRTDSGHVRIKLVLKTLSADVAMSIYSCQSAYVYFGERTGARYAGLVHPNGYNERTAEATFGKAAQMEDVTVFLPRNELIEDITVSVDDGARIEAPTPYRYAKPILYYGSSITEGGCCSKTANSYPALLSRMLDVDYYNFGFSGAARGELPLADYFNTIPKSVFVLDYDHNAPNADFLRQTHEPFFKRLREKEPLLPILLLTMPDFGASDTAERREIIRETYENAVRAGDKNVYFVDGGTYFPKDIVHACTNDAIHPNDLGFYFMAQRIAPTLKSILEQS